MKQQKIVVNQCSMHSLMSPAGPILSLIRMFELEDSIEVFLFYWHLLYVIFCLSVTFRYHGWFYLHIALPFLRVKGFKIAVFLEEYKPSSLLSVVFCHFSLLLHWIVSLLGLQNWLFMPPFHKTGCGNPGSHMNVKHLKA